MKSITTKTKKRVTEVFRGIVSYSEVIERIEKGPPELAIWKSLLIKRNNVWKGKLDCRYKGKKK